VTSPRGAQSLRDVVLSTDDVSLTVDPSNGARFSSLVIGGHEILVTQGAGPIWWGCFPMLPFAGRIRDGRFRFRGRSYDIPRTMPPHAIHGTVLDRTWAVVARDRARVELATDLGPDWPFPGRATHSITLAPGGLEATLVLEAEEPMPASLGWHPWFQREVGGMDVELSFEARSMYVRGPDGLPDGTLGPPRPRPWDDAFTDLLFPPRLTWPGLLELELTSTEPVWVVFDERANGICVEPQTAPPDAFNLAMAEGRDPPSALPGRPLVASMAWRWSRRS
jgi:aldose 1-epimerase